ncbi:MAG: hypothetical protein ACI9SK_001295 [Zhongshania sp.]|jgi:hypothetical protein
MAPLAERGMPYRQKNAQQNLAVKRQAFDTAWRAVQEQLA